MLRERIFQIGGLLLFALGALLIVGYALSGGLVGGFAYGGVLAVLFGAFAWHVGSEARRDREAVLSLGEPPGPPRGG